jgi:hypothetical protein
MSDERVILNREELFDEVWSKPISRLAKEYGLSDVGLAKICKRMEIPRPKRGYWQKLEVGRAPPKPSLKPLSPGGVKQVVVTPNHGGGRSPGQGGEIEKIPFPESHNDPHLLTNKSLRALETAKAGDRGILIPRNKICLDIRVTRDSTERACLIMDTLIKALEERNHTLKVVKDNPARTVVSVDDEEIEIGIDEKTRAVERVPTPDEKRRYADYSWWSPGHDYLPQVSFP